MVTLNVWHVNETEFDAVIDAFEAQNPMLASNSNNIPGAPSLITCRRAYAGGTPPDARRQDDDEISFFVQRGALLSLTNALSDLNPDEFFWDALSSTAINGEV